MLIYAIRQPICRQTLRFSIADYFRDIHYETIPRKKSSLRNQTTGHHSPLLPAARTTYSAILQAKYALD